MVNTLDLNFDRRHMFKVVKLLQFAEVSVKFEHQRFGLRKDMWRNKYDTSIFNAGMHIVSNLFDWLSINDDNIWNIYVVELFAFSKTVLNHWHDVMFHVKSDSAALGVKISIKILKS